MDELVPHEKMTTVRMIIATFHHHMRIPSKHINFLNTCNSSIPTTPELNHPLLAMRLRELEQDRSTKLRKGSSHICIGRA